MSEIVLSGLVGNHPLGALAAFGLLRCASQVEDLKDSRLAWRNESAVAVLHTVNSSADDLVSALVMRQDGRSASDFLTWSDDIKMSPAKFREQLADVQKNAHPDDPQAMETSDYFAAFGSEMVKARSTDDVKPTAFHMTAGQQRFIQSARRLAESLDPTTAEQAKRDSRRKEVGRAFREALLGPWLYQDPQHSLGWDPATEALHALSARAPTDVGPSSVRAAVWLAFEALPLFPSVAVGTKLRTRGFDPDNRWFSWPLWKTPISLDTLRSLLALSTLIQDQPSRGDLHGRGVFAVYRCRRATDANGRGTFRDAMPSVMAD